ncbi:serine/threonine-protein kinase RIO1-like [Gigantopelta aegis]|uniref:serine/threonine-protein kinase RIO1-like n=1 Tax=Gigantopelta aegis TaxID=1735272 RepID=UPI001B889B54|nr:serine/threonine-protein kinase RIO1-like [Gigantopelta aegis]
MEEIVVGQFDDAEQNNEESISTENPILLKDVNIESDGNPDDYDSEYEDDDEDADYDWEDGIGDLTKKYKAAVTSNKQPNSRQPNQQVKKNISKFQPAEKSLHKYVQKINVEKYYGPDLSSFAVSSLAQTGRKMDADSYRGKDKADRATAEQVMDPRTRMIVFKMLSRGVMTEINGCISTGKEANVYHATAKDKPDRAVKIYKTSILVFKDRDKYVTGEFRFRHGYCKHNPRKMVRTWAEKEMRNLIRIHQAGIRCPEPIMLRSHVLVMGFIGSNGWPAPLLKDVTLSESKARELYLECIHMMRSLYHECHLIHADLSEFNLLYDDGHLCVIDVSQSVEHDHPHALEFLRKDCTNITEYFRKNQVSTMTIKELFDFITDLAITEENIDDYLDKAMSISANRTYQDVSEQEKIDEEVFKHSYIPRTLDEVINFEQDYRKAKAGTGEKVLYHTVTGLNQDLSGVQKTPHLLDKSQDDGVCERLKGSGDASSDSDSDGSGSQSGDDGFGSQSGSEGDETHGNKPISRRPRDESPNSKKLRKKVTKEAQREKRKTKVPKHVKKRREKITKQGKPIFNNFLSWKPAEMKYDDDVLTATTMFSRLWNFIKRHRKKFIFTGTVVCGGWLIYKYLQKRIKELRDTDDKEYITLARKQHHFESNQRTCNMTVLSMLPNLRENVERILNSEPVTAMLKSNPSNKLQLWEELKILSFTRSITAVYGCSIMSLLLRVQLNIIGGYIYLDSLSGGNKTASHDGKAVLAPQHLQQRYLSLVKYFLNQGLKDLALYIQQVVSKEISSLSLKQGISLTNIHGIMTHIRERIECGRSDLICHIPTMPLCQYMLPGEQVISMEMRSQEDQIYDRLVNETRDIIESTDFHAVLQNCLDRGFSSYMDCLAEHYKHQTKPTSHLHDVTIPLAKLVPVVDTLLYKLCCDAPNPLMQELLLLEDVKTLSANIYEAFSDQVETTKTD